MKDLLRAVRKPRSPRTALGGPDPRDLVPGAAAPGAASLSADGDEPARAASVGQEGRRTDSDAALLRSAAAGSAAPGSATTASDAFVSRASATTVGGSAGITSGRLIPILGLLVFSLAYSVVPSTRPYQLGTIAAWLTGGLLFLLIVSPGEAWLPSFKLGPAPLASPGSDPVGAGRAVSRRSAAGAAHLGGRRFCSAPSSCWRSASA